MRCYGQRHIQPLQIKEACFSTESTEYCYSYHNFSKTFENADRICISNNAELLSSFNVQRRVLLLKFKHFLKTGIWIRKIDSEEDDTYAGMYLFFTLGAF